MDLFEFSEEKMGNTIRVIKMIPVFKMGNKYKTQEEKK